jgi:iron complex transport system ATP-binding protein
VGEARQSAIPEQLAGATPLLALEHARARYEGAARPAVDSVSLSVRAGQLTALLGPNGAGKSTLLRVGAGLLGLESGRVSIAGQDARGMDRRKAARLVALVPQSEPPAAGFAVREVVAMGRAPHQDGWMSERVEDRAAVEEAMARCDLTSVAGRAVEALSGGEQRRVSVARALATRPRVLLLDEPAAFLDVRHRLELYDLLSDVVVRDGIGCLVAMHDLDSAARVAHHVVLMRDGRVVAEGPADEVMTLQTLRDTFDAEIDVGVHAPSGRRYFVPVRSSGG